MDDDPSEPAIETRTSSSPVGSAGFTRQRGNRDAEIKEFVELYLHTACSAHSRILYGADVRNTGEFFMGGEANICYGTDFSIVLWVGTFGFRGWTFMKKRLITFLKTEVKV